MKLRRKHKVYGVYDDQFCIKNFRFASTGSSGGSLRIIVPEKSPHINAVEPEDGMVTSQWIASRYWVPFHHGLENLEVAIAMGRGAKRGDGTCNN